MAGSYRSEGPLTARQVQVLAGKAAGETMRDTAARLHVSPHTVETECRAAYARLGARNGYQAVAIAQRQGLIE